jgi:FMN phosphatase YigB (HAD superfamily)
MSISAVFLDVDGVINDHTLNPGMWDSLMGDVLAPALGATPADWGRANRLVFPRIWAQNEDWGTDPLERIRTESQLILNGMCQQLGLAPPSAEDCFELWKAVDLYIAGTARAAFPFAAESIRTLAGLVTVHTATGNPSWRVETLLGALGVRQHVGFPAGPDLVGIWKNDVDYYRRIFAVTKIPPAEALIVDDSPGCIELALKAGARAAHVCAAACPCPADLHVATLAAVPAMLETPASTRASGQH